MSPSFSHCLTELLSSPTPDVYLLMAPVLSWEEGEEEMW